MHPVHLLTADDLAVLEVFNAWHGSGPMGGRGPLPFAGGAAEQPAGLMRCLYHMAAVTADLTPKKREET